MKSSDIQSHLYNSFLNGQTSDVCIRITGAFNATYNLHRVILIQAGFWRELFTGGFIESSGRRQSGSRVTSNTNTVSSFGNEIFDVVLDDQNISRAAFEVSIARLYGGGPPLYIHPSLVPTSTHPLTSVFPYQSALPVSSSLLYPHGYQPATPEFLLSLLATSIYLSIPSLVSEALTGILKTIGPLTVGCYLDFALGRTKLGSVAVDCPAVGLDGLARDSNILRSPSFHPTYLPVENHSGKASGMHRESHSPLIVGSPSSPSSTSSLCSTSDESLFPPFMEMATSRKFYLPRVTDLPSTQFYYGPISDKIGEACACWLARWGADMFLEEEKVVLDWLNDSNASLETWTSLEEERDSEDLPSSSGNRPGLLTTSAYPPKWSLSNTKSIPRFFTATAVGPDYEGLSLSWIHALISSDDFFVPAPSLYASSSITSSTSTQSTFGGPSARETLPAAYLESPEEERYAFAKRVVELRRTVRAKVRRLQRKQMGVDKESDDGDTFSSHSQCRQLKGKERRLNTPHLDVVRDDPFPPEHQGGIDNFGDVRIDEWKQWSEIWQYECDEEEEQWAAFFKSSIYYANMSPEAVINISKDMSSSTGRPYVDLRTLQEATWVCGIVRTTITGGTSDDALSRATDRLGFAKTVSDTLSAFAAERSPDNEKPYFTIAVDESLRIGDTITTSNGMNSEGNIHNNITMDELFASSFGESYLRRADNSSAPSPSGNGRTGERTEPEKNAPVSKTSNEHTFFGLRANIYYASRKDDALAFVPSPSPFLFHSPPCLQLPSSQLLSVYPPLRFSIEFFNLEMLKEKERIHSRTVWYAGSLWNVYVQVVRRKEKGNAINVPNSSGDVQTYQSPGSGLPPNHQLGIYLHRQSFTEIIPPFSAPDPFADSRRSCKSHFDPTSSSSPAYSSSSPNSPATLSTFQVPTSLEIPTSSSPVPRGPTFPPLTTYASAPQTTSSSSTISHSTAPSSRLRGNSASIPVSPSRPTTGPGSPSSSSARPRTPGGSGGWRGLATSHCSNSSNSVSGSNFLSSSLPTVFPTFGRIRHQAYSRDRTSQTINNGILGASASSPYVSGPTLSSLPSATMPSSSKPTAPSASTDKSLPNPPFHAVVNSKIIYPYRDPRQVVSVYFSINCASPTGSAQTRFRSAPDVFKIGQSWGWKSSGLLGGLQETDSTNISKTDGDFEAALIQMDRKSPPVSSHEVSFRATVVLGIV